MESVPRSRVGLGLVGRTAALVSGVFSLPLLDPAVPYRDFLAGEENALVRVARRVVLEDDRDHLPLVICGPTGAGKTFLAEGLAEAWRQAAAGREVLRITGVDFARQYADACDTDSIGDFRESSSKAGLILVDAIHRLVAKERAAREFCFQLESWLAAGKIVIVTSLPSPLDWASCGGANAGLASRLSAGLVLPLALPSLDARRELLTYFARQRALDLSDDLIDFLAERVPGAVTTTPSPRDLLAALVQLESTAKLTGCGIDAGLIESLFQPQSPGGDIAFKHVQAAVVKRFGITADELRSSSRRQSLVRARGVAILLARRLTGESLQSLGKSLGNRDHSTIHHALQTIEQAVADDNSLRELVESLHQDLANSPRPRKAARHG